MSQVTADRHEINVGVEGVTCTHRNLVTLLHRKPRQHHTESLIIRHPGGSKRPRTTVASPILLFGATATACSDSKDAKPAATVTVTKTVTATPSTEAAADANAGVLKMGTKKAIDDTENNIHATVQALEYQQPYKGPQPQKPEDFQGGDI